MGKQITHQIFSTIMYGQGYGYVQQAPVTWAQPSYAQSTHEYLGPAKVLNWTPTEREVWDTDLWGQQVLRYELDDQRDSAERDLTYAQDEKRAELDEVWEFYKKKTQYKYDQYKTADHGHGDYADEYGSDYTHYDKLDVRETMLRANQLWDADVLTMRQAVREGLEAEREAHRADLAQVNAALDAEVRSLISQGNDEVEKLNDIHQELVLSILEAVDYYGEEADIKLILTQAG